MRRRSFAACSLVTLLVACGAGKDAQEDDRSAVGDASTVTDGTPPGMDGFGGEVGDDAPPCPASETSVSGVVHTPAKTDPDPLYNVIVFVPSGSPEAFPENVTCDKCGAIPSAKALVATLTDAQGKFKLEGVPPGKNVPLVLQIGRWRRQVVVPEVKACGETKLPAELTRLPRNQKEGDIPRMAIASAKVDPTECLLRKIGIDDEEFTTPSGKGRVHVYLGSGATLGADTPPSSTLWGSIDTLKKYDLVLLPCESSPIPKDAASMQRLIDYTAVGGRVFATHYSYVWFQPAPAPFNTTAKWYPSTTGGMTDPTKATVDMTYPKGVALAKWLINVGASTDLGTVMLNETRHNVDAVVPPSQQWIYTSSPATVQHFTFNTPVEAKPKDQCGRVVYSNFHIVKATTTGTFPGECGGGPLLTPQEKVLEFMLFDLASCVQTDTDAPTAPVIK